MQFNQEELKQYLSKTPQSISATTMRNLERSSRFKDALESEYGKLLLDDLILLLDEKFKKIIDGKDDELDRAVFKACQIVGDRWNKKIKAYVANCNKIKEKIV